jgi:alcohol dehydrogenase class IV
MFSANVLIEALQNSKPGDVRVGHWLQGVSPRLKGTRVRVTVAFGGGSFIEVDKIGTVISSNELSVQVMCDDGSCLWCYACDTELVEDK